MTTNTTLPSHVTFAGRLAKIQTVADAEKQLELAKAYANRCRSDSKKANLLPDKLNCMEKEKQAEIVLRKLRMAIFDIEDELAGIKPRKLLPAPEPIEHWTLVKPDESAWF